MTILSATGLSKRFGQGEQRIWAVRDTTFSIERGEKVAITGPSGCGKTTLLNLLGLVLRPTEGALEVEGQALKDLTENTRAAYRNRFFGYIVQDFALVEDNTVLENVEIPLLYARPGLIWAKRRQRVMEVLEQVGLSDKVRSRAKALSGGQRQRVAIARAIVNDPRIILADEPTGSLDSDAGEQVMALLEELVNRGKTLLLVTHNMDLANRCDRHFRMTDGMII